MHPLGLYLAITGSNHDRDWGVASERPALFARVDATPIVEPERPSRIGRVAAIVRRRVMRTAGI